MLIKKRSQAEQVSLLATNFCNKRKQLSLLKLLSEAKILLYKYLIFGDLKDKAVDSAIMQLITIINK